MSRGNLRGIESIGLIPSFISISKGGIGLIRGGLGGILDIPNGIGRNIGTGLLGKGVKPNLSLPNDG